MERSTDKMRYMSFIILLTFLGVLFINNPVLAEQVKCEQCSEEYPCITVLEFKEVKFAHNIYCFVDEEGSEHWDSEDGSKLELFYRLDNFDQENEKPKLNI
jgi:hypothetical protein